MRRCIKYGWRELDWTLYFMWMVMVTNQNWASFIFISVSANTNIFYIYLYLNRYKNIFYFIFVSTNIKIFESLSQQTSKYFYLCLNKQQNIWIFVSLRQTSKYLLSLSQQTQYNLFKKSPLFFFEFLQFVCILSTKAGENPSFYCIQHCQMRLVVRWLL